MKTHLGHYEIVAELGRGGMGVVYKGYEPALNRFVAIKELSPSLAHDESLVERFLREARSMAALNDPHIIQIYFIGQENDQPFFVMEFVEGDSLSGLLKREPRLPLETALKIIHQTSLGLATAHDRGVVHRDIKPGNLMIGSRGQVKIADFGIALATQDISKKLTSTGEFVGTPGYLSPEVCLGKQVDQRSDIFSLGIVLFEMLSGKTPFSDESPLGLMLEVVKADIPDIRELNSEADPQTSAILARMVAKDPADRFQNCHDLAAALQAHPLVSKGGPISVSAPRPLASDATVVGAPTPMSSPQRVPTPPPVVGRTPPPAPAAEVHSATRVRPGAERPSVLDRQQDRRGSRMAMAVAAGLVLLAAGSVFAFRAPLGEFVAGFSDGFTGSRYEDGVAAGQASNPIGSSQAATAPPPGAEIGNGIASTQDGAQTDFSRPAPQVALANGNRPEASAAGDAMTAEQRSAAIAADAAAAGPAALGSSVAAADAGAMTLVAAAPVPAASDPAATVAAPGQAAGTGPAVQQQAAPQLASSTPPREVTPPPAPVPRRVAVVTIGDSAITGPARQRIEERLAGMGFDIADSDTLDGVGAESSLPQILAALRREAIAVVVVRAESIGSQELQYYGQNSTLYSAYLGVRAYSVADKRPLGAGFRGKIDFTTLNADSKALELVEPQIDEVVTELLPYRARRRG